MGTVKNVFITEHEDTAWLLYWGGQKIKQTNVCFIYIYFIVFLCGDKTVKTKNICLSFFYEMVQCRDFIHIFSPK